MKKIFFISIAFILLVTSCKKEEALKAPAADASENYLIGDWKNSEFKLKGTTQIKSGNYNYGGGIVQRDIEYTNNLIVTSYSDSIYPVGYNSLSQRPTYQTLIDSGYVEENRIKFSKDQTWTKMIKYTVYTTSYFVVHHTSCACPANTPGWIECKKGLSIENVIIQSSGKWEFLDAADGYKKNERISLTKLTESLTANTSNGIPVSFVDGTNVQIWHLIVLKNKEFKFEMLGDYEDTFLPYSEAPLKIISRNLSGTFVQ